MSYPSIYVYCVNQTPRVTYIFKTLSIWMDVSFELLSDLDVFAKKTSPKFSYNQNYREGFYLCPNPILFEDTTSPQKSLQVFDEKQKAYMFKTQSNFLAFDLFAAIFYLISRQEEYRIAKKDNHNRFDYRESIAFKHGFLEYPIIDKWILDFKTTLIEKLKLNPPPKKHLQHHISIDVDQLYAFKNRGYKALPFFIKSCFTNPLLAFRYLFKHKDPYDYLDFLNTLPHKHTAFLHVGHKTKYDAPNANSEYIELAVACFSKAYQIGLHPSYYSSEALEVLAKEKKLLESQAKTSITSSRQHFLRFSLPKTYQSLLSLGISDEYSMGYSESPGFRASTSRSFLWFDLQNNKMTDLWVHPFWFMDVQLLKGTLSPNKAKEIIGHLKQYDGVNHMVLHNHFFAFQTNANQLKQKIQTILGYVS